MRVLCANWVSLSERVRHDDGRLGEKRPLVLEISGSRLFNADAVAGAAQHLADGSVDLVVTDPPYGIGGDRLHQHYNRDEQFVVDGYIEVPPERYGDFTESWISQAARVLRPGGSLYVVSGYTHLYEVLRALRSSGLQEVNHLIWKYNFGVFTSRKYVSSHYHILYYAKPGGRRIFNLQARYATNESSHEGGSSNYRDREDVFTINRTYKPGREKNKNELPAELLEKLLQYSSDEGDVVCDFFMGGGSTGVAATGMNRRFAGFELSKPAFESCVAKIAAVTPGELLSALQSPANGRHVIGNAGKTWSESEIDALVARYRDLSDGGQTKGRIVEMLAADFHRGSWSIVKLLKKLHGRLAE